MVCISYQVPQPVCNIVCLPSVPILDIDRIVEEEPAEGSSTSGAVNLAQLGPNLDRLWAYTCSLTKGRNVSCMSWNKLNKVKTLLVVCGHNCCII